MLALASDWIIAAAAVPVVSVAAVAVSKSTWRAACRAGRWAKREAREAVSESLAEMVSPDIKRMGDSLGGSLDALRAENREQHAAVETALATLSSRVDGLDGRLTALEERAREAGPQTVRFGRDP